MSKNNTGKEMYFSVNNYIMLKPLNESNAQESYDLVNKNRSLLKEWLPWIDSVKTVTDELHFIQRSAAATLKKEKFELGVFINKTFELHDQDDAEMQEKVYSEEVNHWKLVGMCGFVEIANNCGWLGYWLDRDFQGKGIITKACQCILTDVCKFLGLSEVRLHIAPENNKSLSLAKRLGFKTNNILEKTNLFGKEVDVLLFRMQTNDNN